MNGRELRAVRRLNNWTQRELATRLGVGRSVISRCEGKPELDVGETSKLLAAALKAGGVASADQRASAAPHSERRPMRPAGRHPREERSRQLAIQARARTQLIIELDDDQVALLDEISREFQLLESGVVGNVKPPSRHQVVRLVFAEALMQPPARLASYLFGFARGSRPR